MDVIVVGGGPAGLMAAGRAAELGARVLLLEKNPSLGKKLLISGGGRCNFTNAQPDRQTLVSHYGAAGRALMSPFSKFSPEDCLHFFADRGMAYQIEDNYRAFPASQQAQSVLSVLTQYLAAGRVQVQTAETVLELTTTGQQMTGVRTARRHWPAASVVLATGGISHPETGSTGDGFRWLEALGHAVRYPEPSLVPVAVKEPWIAVLQGLSFPQVGLSAWVGDDCLFQTSGKLLFTHFGLSGPMVLNAATELQRLRQKTARLGELQLRLDFFPEQSAPELDQELLRRCAEQKNRKVKNALVGLLPPRLIEQILTSAGGGEQTLHQWTREERQALGRSLKGFRLTFKRLMDASRAIVNSGGLALTEVDFRSMTSKRYPNLAVTGDLLDIERPSGGFSLQLCWATGWVAGEALAAVHSGHDRHH